MGHQGTEVEIKDVDLNESMVRAIARQAEAERLRRAKIINAEGEQQAAEKLVEAGRMLAQNRGHAATLFRSAPRYRGRTVFDRGLSAPGKSARASRRADKIVNLVVIHRSPVVNII